MIDPSKFYTDSYKEIEKAVGPDKRQLASAVMAVFKLQNAGEVEHEDEDIHIARRMVTEVILNRDTSEPLEDLLAVLPGMPLVVHQVGGDLLKQRLVNLMTSRITT